MANESKLCLLFWFYNHFPNYIWRIANKLKLKKKLNYISRLLNLIYHILNLFVVFSKTFGRDQYHLISSHFKFYQTICIWPFPKSFWYFLNYTCCWTITNDDFAFYLVNMNYIWYFLIFHDVFAITLMASLLLLILTIYKWHLLNLLYVFWNWNDISHLLLMSSQFDLIFLNYIWRFLICVDIFEITTGKGVVVATYVMLKRVKL